MSLISGSVTENARILIYDMVTETLVVDQGVNAGAYEFTNLDAHEKIVVATHSGTGESISYGKVVPAGEPPVEAIYNILIDEDDGYTETDTKYFNYTFGWVMFEDNNHRNTYHRFDNLPIPKDSTIEYAYIRIRCAENTGAFTHPWYGDTRTDAARPADGDDFINIRDNYLTTAKVDWTLGGATAGVYYDTNSLVPIVQEIVNGATWESGHAIQFLGIIDGDEDGWFRSTNMLTKLHIKFQSP